MEGPERASFRMELERRVRVEGERGLAGLVEEEEKSLLKLKGGGTRVA